MQRPSVASSPKRNRNRMLKQAVGKQTCRPLRRRLSPRLPLGRTEAAPIVPQISAAADPSKGAAAEAVAAEPMRCGFGAVRVGALLGRLRLHLHTDRFLAVHRGDTLWERGCVGAALELAVIAAGMAQEELDAALLPQRMQERHASGTPVPMLPENAGAALKGGATYFGDGSFTCEGCSGARQASDISAMGPERGASGTPVAVPPENAGAALKGGATYFGAGSSPCGRCSGDRQPSDISAMGPERGAQ